jgi:gluconate 2-dehydrogenase subunit 3-like protein
MPYRPPRKRAVTPQSRGRYPGFDVLDQIDVWDNVTAGVVLARLGPPHDLSFFTPAEVAIALPLLDLLLAQDSEPRVPVLPLIDLRLATGQTDGWHYDDLPEDATVWRRSLAFIDEDTYERHGHGFAEATSDQQAGCIQAVQDLSGSRWHGFPATQVWSLWTRYACSAFYSHPWAWNEIGFGGPAYPRGYLNPGIGAREKWEVADHHAIDPVPFSQRVERARRQHDTLRGKTGS